MKQNETAQVRQQDPFSFGAPGFYGGQGQGLGQGLGQGGYPSYPGYDNPFLGGGISNLPVPYTPPTTLVGGGGAGAGAGGSGSSFNLGQIKGFIDKMGGIEGIVGAMTRVQKVVSNFQQMAPMIKLLLSSFGKASAKSVKSDSSGTTHRRTRKRRRKGKRSLKKYDGKTWTPKGGKRR